MKKEISQKGKEAVHNLIFERAYEIENKLSEDNFFYAKIAGVSPQMVSEVSLQCAIKELQNTFKN